MKELPLRLQHKLESLDHHSGRRTLVLPQGHDFSSNDYLGFASDEELTRRFREESGHFSLGSTGSRLLRGHSSEFVKLEKDVALFSGSDAALFFSSGYQANLGLYSAVASEGDVVFSDQYNHASIVDGLKLSKATRVIYAHNNIVDLRRKLETTQVESGVTKFIVTESLFSMDGDIAPLRELALLAEEFSCHFIVDEAHATGLYGNFDSNRGAGLVQALSLEDKVFATVHTGGKALGAAGAWVAGRHELKEFLVNFSRPFIFSTAPQPGLAVLLSLSLRFWSEVGRSRAIKLRTLSEHFFATARNFEKLSLKESAGPIIPLILGSNQSALQAAEHLRAQGFDVRAIRPPTVPEGTSRLRVTLHSEMEPKIIADFLTALGDLK